MHFLYFIADRQRSITPAELPALGLAYAFDRPPVSRDCYRGPDGHAGLVLAATEERIGYFPERQTWRPFAPLPLCPSAAAIYVGYYTDAKPTPDDLAWPEQISGYSLQLEDGHAWQAPTARRWEEVEDQLYWSHNLPQRLTLADGKWVTGGVKPKYERLWQLVVAYETAAAAAIAASEDSAEAVRFRFDDIDDMAVAALQTNYRVGPVELDVLGIYDVTARRRIIDALLDNDTWNAWQKKRLAAAPAGGASSNGPAPSSTAEATPIAPPSAT